MEENQNVQPPAEEEAEEEEVEEKVEDEQEELAVLWPNVRPGREMTRWERAHERQQLVLEHMAMNRIISLEDVRRVAHRFIPTIPPLLLTNVAGPVYVQFDFDDIQTNMLTNENLPQEGTIHDRFQIENALFSGARESCFWMLTMYHLLGEQTTDQWMEKLF